MAVYPPSPYRHLDDDDPAYCEDCGNRMGEPVLCAHHAKLRDAAYEDARDEYEAYCEREVERRIDEREDDD